MTTALLRVALVAAAAAALAAADAGTSDDVARGRVLQSVPGAWSSVSSVGTPATDGGALALNVPVRGVNSTILYGGVMTDGIDGRAFYLSRNAREWQPLGTTNRARRYFCSWMYKGELYVGYGLSIWNGATVDLASIIRLVPDPATGAPMWLQWTPVNATEGPAGRHSASCIVRGNLLIMYGGFSETTGTLWGDLWAFDIENRIWTQLTPILSPRPANAPRVSATTMTGLPAAATAPAQLYGPQRSMGHSSAYLPDLDTMVLFGGQLHAPIVASADILNEAWGLVFSGPLTGNHSAANITARWVPLAIDGPLIARSYAAGAYIQHTGQFCVFGGVAGWTFTGGAQVTNGIACISMRGVVRESLPAAMGRRQLQAPAASGPGAAASLVEYLPVPTLQNGVTPTPSPTPSVTPRAEDGYLHWMALTVSSPVLPTERSRTAFAVLPAGFTYNATGRASIVTVTSPTLMIVGGLSASGGLLNDAWLLPVPPFSASGWSDIPATPTGQFAMLLSVLAYAVAIALFVAVCFFWVVRRCNAAAACHWGHADTPPATAAAAAAGGNNPTGAAGAARAGRTASGTAGNRNGLDPRLIAALPTIVFSSSALKQKRKASAGGVKRSASGNGLPAAGSATSARRTATVAPLAVPPPSISTASGALSVYAPGSVMSSSATVGSGVAGRALDGDDATPRLRPTGLGSDGASDAGGSVLPVPSVTSRRGAGIVGSDAASTSAAVDGDDVVSVCSAVALAGGLHRGDGDDASTVAPTPRAPAAGVAAGGTDDASPDGGPVRVPVLTIPHPTVAGLRAGAVLAPISGGGGRSAAGSVVSIGTLDEEDAAGPSSGGGGGGTGGGLPQPLSDDLDIMINTSGSVGSMTTATNWADAHVTCAICMCEYEDGDVLMILPCLHRYHTQCVSVWLKQRRSCPMCKVDVSAYAVW